jgi:hypothetical protein
LDVSQESDENLTAKYVKRQSRNQRRKDNFHHEGTKNTKEDFSRKGAKGAKEKQFVISTPSPSSG